LLSGQSESFTYTVSWFDSSSLSKKKFLNFKGLFIRGNRSMHNQILSTHTEKPRLTIPFYFPNFALNSFTVIAFNSLFYLKGLFQRSAIQHYDPFFYPRDSIGRWNRIYGKRGLYQFQCTLPFEFAESLLIKINAKIYEYRSESFLSVLKLFGEINSPGLLSYPSPGVTLCLDFPNNGKQTRTLITYLYDLVTDCGGRLYPAKDALMTPEHFKKSYPNFEKFLKFKDPKFESLFSQRVLENL